MAYTETADLASFVAGATFSTADLYKFVVVTTSGEVVLPNTTGNVLPVGVLYGVTSTTNSSGVQAVPVGIGGVVKVQMASSTQHAGNFVASSTDGLGITATTDAYVFGVIKTGSSGGAGRVHSVVVARGPLSAP